MEPFVLDNTPEPPKPGPVLEPADKTTQRVLFSGLDCLAGQMDLFATDGESDE